MSSGFTHLPELWWTHAVEASIEFTCFALVVLALDVLLARCAPPEPRAALWLAVLAKLLFPSAFPAALRWSLPTSIVPRVWGVSIGADATTASNSAWLAPTAFAAWLAGLAVCASIGVARYRGLRRRRWCASEATPPFVDALSCQVAARLGLGRRTNVRVFDGPGGPVLLGFVRPVVFVPRALLSNERREELELVLLHELAHVKRRDPLWSLLCIAIQWLHWFHPLAWLARRRLVLLRELSCDRTVSRALGGDTASYRRTLLMLARPWTTSARDGALAFLTPRSQLAVRVRSLERPLLNNVRLSHVCSAVLFTLFFACCLPKATEQVVPFPYELPPLEDLEGCLRLRFAVHSMTNHARNVDGSELARLLTHSPTVSINDPLPQ